MQGNPTSTGSSVMTDRAFVPSDVTPLLACAMLLNSPFYSSLITLSLARLVPADRRSPAFVLKEQVGQEADIPRHSSQQSTAVLVLSRKLP